MKFLECPTLASLSEALNHEGPECSVHTRIEAYSCKQIKRDKKLFKTLNNAYKDDLASSPPLPSWMGLDREAEMTPFGPIGKESSRKTLYLLISTLNNAFPDYDFSNIQPSQFNKEESGASVLNALSTTLVAPHRAGMSAPRTYSSYPPSSSDFFPSSEPTSSSPLSSILRSPFTPPLIVSGTHPTLFRLIDDVIGLAECEVFSYTPEIDSDPHANDFSDDEDDIPSVGYETSSSDEELFEFDDYDVDEIRPSGRYKSGTIAATPRAAVDSSLSSYLSSSRILFISVWARSRGLNRSWTSDEEFEALDAKVPSERFFGWEGGVGAGARALGL
ncbi:Maf1 regulator-domain-containing protein [Mycena amicta]|nr:Maf1 regulator-domain-containing protein [Mycena amicta]